MGRNLIEGRCMAEGRLSVPHNTIAGHEGDGCIQFLQWCRENGKSIILSKSMSAMPNGCAALEGTVSGLLNGWFSYTLFTKDTIDEARNLLLDIDYSVDTTISLNY